ncbi:MAG: hypothetical protein JWM02_1303 [Frankiales bacterium]|nr:hypothetical protein [Frankiales bacterium]
MTTLALASAKGAPGVTTSALLLAALWPRPACLVEADPRGGDLRYWQTDPDGQPLRPDAGVVSLLAERRTPASVQDRGSGTDPGGGLLAHTQRIAGSLPVLVGVSTPRQHQALAPMWPELSAGFATLTMRGPDVAPSPRQDDSVQATDLMVDVGGLTGDPATLALLHSTSMVLLVCLPTVSSLAHTRDALVELRASARWGSQQLGVIVIGSGADRDAVRDVLTADLLAGLAVGPARGALFMGQLAADPAAARALAGSWTRRLDRSPLVASGRRLARELDAHLQHLPAVTAADFGPAGGPGGVDVDALVGPSR